MSSDFSHCLETQANQTDSDSAEGPGSGWRYVLSENYSVTLHGAAMSQILKYELNMSSTVFSLYYLYLLQF